MEVLYADPHLVVVDKPAGLLTVGTGSGADGRGRRAGASESTLLKETAPLVASRVDPRPRFFPCHRLDKDTSGLVILPRTREVQQWFFEHWHDDVVDTDGADGNGDGDGVQKRYLAVTTGGPKNDAGTIDIALMPPDPQFNVRVAPTLRSGLHPDALPARTDYEVLERRRHTSLVACTLFSGRQHQIRVHLASLGCPIVGDVRYNTERGRAPRLGLHAWQLSFRHPVTGERGTFTSEPPPAFRALLT